MRHRRTRTLLEPANEPSERAEGCPIHAYRNNASIFVDPIDRTGFVPTFGSEQRLLPVLGALGGGLEEYTSHPRKPEDISSSVHSYEKQSFFRPSGCGMPEWRQVGEKVRRVRPPKPERKPAIHGSSLARKRHAQHVHDNPPSSPVRTTIVRGSSLTVTLAAAAGYASRAGGLGAAPLLYSQQQKIPPNARTTTGGLGGGAPPTPLYRSMGLGGPRAGNSNSAPEMIMMRTKAMAPEMLTLPPIR